MRADVAQAWVTEQLALRTQASDATWQVVEQPIDQGGSSHYCYDIVRPNMTIDTRSPSCVGGLLMLWGCVGEGTVDGLVMPHAHLRQARGALPSRSIALAQLSIALSCCSIPSRSIPCRSVP